MSPVRVLSLLALPLALTTACLGHHRKACGDCPESSAKNESFGRLSVQEVSDLISKGEASVFDDNNAQRFHAGHVPGATWMPYDAVSAEKLPADKDRTLVFYCANERCGACHKAADEAVRLGYTRVFIMPAGIAGWEAAGLAVETD